MPSLDRFAEAFATIAIKNIHRGYPQRVDGILTESGSYVEPARLHPAFHGSYDWHSCVHMHWLLVRLLASVSSGNWRAEAIRTLRSRLADDNIQKECAYLSRAENAVFERPYGWAWVLKLQTELVMAARSSISADAKVWTKALKPLADLLSVRLQDYLSAAHFPIRAGTHGNSAFAMLMAFEFAAQTGEATFARLIRQRASDWFLNDRAYPASYEPDGEDFLSGGMLEASLMATLLDDAAFQQWWQQFQPDERGMRQWMTPIESIARHDAKIVHLVGLNLSRAWCWRLLASRLPATLKMAAKSAADAHLRVSLPDTTTGEYGGSHWLASFGALALAG